jgi:outer membrane lipoprotein-sorting protein
MSAKFNHSLVRVIVIALATLVLVVSQGLTADWSTVLKEAKAKYAKFEKEIKDMTITQEIKLITPDGVMPSEAKMLRKGEKFRTESKIQIPQMESEMASIEMVIIYDGKETWMVSSIMGKKKLSDEEDKIYQKERNWWQVISEKAEIVGSEKVGDRECYLVLIKEEKESPFTRIWVDQKNLVLVQAESKEPEGETMLLVSSDFKKIKDDWEWPYKTEIYVDGNLMTTVGVKSLEINKGLSDELFNPDKLELKGLSMEDMMKKMMEQEK